MEIFCFIYPEAIYEGRVSSIVANLLRSGAVKTSSSIRTFELEEIKMIFYVRRFNPDFDEFCKSLTHAPAAILHLEWPEGDPNKLGEHLDPEQLTQIYVPSDLSVHKTLLRLSDKLGYSKDALGEIVAEFRETLAKNNELDEREFASASLEQLKRLYQYFSAGQAVGFTAEQSFSLTKEMQSYMLFQDEQDNRPAPRSGEEEEG